MTTTLLSEPLDSFICAVGALLKKNKVQDGPEVKAILTFFRTYGYSHIADDLSIFPSVSTV